MVYNLFLDDSGQLHPNYPSSDFFVYGGIFISEKEQHIFRSKYKKLVKQVKREKNIRGELKTSDMDNSTRARLLKSIKSTNLDYYMIFTSVSVNRLKRLDFTNPKDVVRYKNYIIRRLIQELIDSHIVPKECTRMNVRIDNQTIAHSSTDSLEDYLHNYFNEQNYQFMKYEYKENDSSLSFDVLYRDSKSDYMIQAADLLANTFLKHCAKPELKLDRYFINDIILQKHP